ncbi:aldehyde dehydrogenase family protein [Micromonospora echinospora]
MAEVASADFKHVTLELDGKGPAIVFADADLSQAARAAALGFCLGSGQGCVAGSRIKGKPRRGGLRLRERSPARTIRQRPRMHGLVFTQQVTQHLNFYVEAHEALLDPQRT